MHLTIDESKRPTEQASEMKQVSAKKSLWLHPPVHHLTAIGLAGEPVVVEKLSPSGMIQNKFAKMVPTR